MKTTLLAGVVALVAIVVAGVVILSHDLAPGARLIVIQGMFTGVFTVITTLLAATKADRAAVKADDAAAKTAEMHHDLQNGLIPEKVKEAVNEMAADPAQPSVTINSDET
jgi:type VI protein secretion system component VasK